MDRQPGVPDTAIIAQDDQTQVHVQPIVQGTRRQLDVRVWRRSSAGFTPSRIGITLETADVVALQEGINELLQASDGGQRVARVVWDSEDGRRLRAETEPFGTRYVARLGFWQRVRDSWKPVDDGLVIAADRLLSLQTEIGRFLPWLQSVEPDDEPPVSASPPTASLDQWPAAGADWLTSEPDRIAFHPKGVRLTCTVTEQDSRHWLEVRQWRRDDTLWLPEPVSIMLSITDLDSLLSSLLRLSNLQESQTGEATVRCSDGSTLKIGISSGELGSVLHIQQQLPPRGGQALPFEARLWVPASYLPRLGRALAQGWFLLAGWLSEAERTALNTPQQQRQPPPATDLEQSAVPTPQPTPTPQPQPAAEVRRPADIVPVSPVAPSRAPSPRPSQVFSFGAESETPGTVVPGNDEVRIVVEGFLLPRSLTIPIDVVPKVVTGLEELNALRGRQSRVDPVLLSDRPDCAVYGRIGTSMRPDAVELRVWTNPSSSESVSFEAIYLPDLIEGLRECLQLADRPMPPSRMAVEIPATPPAPIPQPSSPARLKPIAPAAPLEAPGPVSPAGAPRVSAPLSVSLGAVNLGQQHILISIQGHAESPRLELRWLSNSLELPVNDLEELLADIRSLYYDALRGRRGRTITVGKYPMVAISVHNQGTELYCILQQDIDGEVTSLSFPANEVPAFLNAARAALTRT